MAMRTDAELLSIYARTGDEAAFADLGSGDEGGEGGV
jgi:hypothetical protein